MPPKLHGATARSVSNTPLITPVPLIMSTDLVGPSLAQLEVGTRLVVSGLLASHGYSSYK